MGAAAAAVIVRERRIVEALAELGATSPERAVHADDLPLGFLHAAERRLARRGVLLTRDDGARWVDLPRWLAVERARRRRGRVALVAVLLVLLVALAAGTVRADGRPQPPTPPAAPPSAVARSAPTWSGDADVGGLPLTVVPAARPGGTLAILLTGDGGWAPLVRDVARTLADGGVGVVALDSRAYLSGATRTPEGTARDVARIARAYGARWDASRVVLVGYSRGADLLPSVATRLPADVRPRVALVAMFGLARAASYEFHWLDLVRDTAHPTDLPVAPDLARLRGTPMLCVYGTDETDSGCRDADASLVTRVARDGKHHFDGDHAALARLVLDALRAP